jgi:hypothetical protein
MNTNVPTSGSGPKNRNETKAKIRFFRLRNKLKDKAGSGVSAGGLGFALEALDEAMEEMGKFSAGYPEWVAGSINELSEALNVAKGAEEQERARPYKIINDIAHDMRGQGGTFGYPLVTMVSKSLHLFTGRNPGTTDNHVEIIKAHIDTMHVVIRERIEGDGGQVGSELMEALDQGIRKLSGRK